MWKSPNGTIRAILDGTVFRAPILIDSIKPVVKNWKKPITIARHAYGDVYTAWRSEYRVEGPGKAELDVYRRKRRILPQTVYDFECPGVLSGSPSTRILPSAPFAHACFKYALSTKQDLWFSTKDTISKVNTIIRFQGYFRGNLSKASTSQRFRRTLGIEYFYTLIDDAVARVIRSARAVISGPARTTTAM